MLARVEQGRQVLRHAAEGLSIGSLRLLDRIPVLLHLGWGPGLGWEPLERVVVTAEHVWMAPHQLLGRATRHPAEVALAALLEQQREEVDLEQHVAELV